jgi:hypothetical protein
MKTFTSFAFVILINAIALTANAQKKIKKQSTIEISGAALLNDKRIKDYSVSVYLDGLKVDSMFSKTTKPLFFTVVYNKVYTLLFQKEGCLDKMIIFNTHVPQGLKNIKDDTFDFEVEMSQCLLKNTGETEDYPAAVLLIDKSTESLEASEAYYKFTHKENTDISNILVELPGTVNKGD